MTDKINWDERLRIFEARLLGDLHQIVLDNMRQMLSPEDAEAAIARIEYWEGVFPMGLGLWLVAGKYVPTEEPACTSGPTA